MPILIPQGKSGVRNTAVDVAAPGERERRRRREREEEREEERERGVRAREE